MDRPSPLFTPCLILLCSLLFLLVSGCARSTKNPVDPYEPFNRRVFEFNQGLDRNVFKPLATIYRKVTPKPVRQGVTNVFNNIEEIRTIPNDLLQGKFRYALVDFCRLMINSTLGLGGLIDVAGKMGLPKHYEDFALTLAYWTHGDVRSPYLTLPFFGPGSVREIFALPFDYVTSPWIYVDHEALGYVAFGLKYLNYRAELLDVSKLMNHVFDPYVFVRDAYLQHRRRMIEENKRRYIPSKERAKLESDWNEISVPETEAGIADTIDLDPNDLPDVNPNTSP